MGNCCSKSGLKRNAQNAGKHAGKAGQLGEKAKDAIDNYMTKTRDKKWDKLSEAERKSATLLQYDEKSWNRETAWYGEWTEWSKLSTDKKKAAEQLGFDEESWGSPTTYTSRMNDKYACTVIHAARTDANTIKVRVHAKGDGSSGALPAANLSRIDVFDCNGCTRTLRCSKADHSTETANEIIADLFFVSGDLNNTKDVAKVGFAYGGECYSYVTLCVAEARSSPKDDPKRSKEVHKCSWAELTDAERSQATLLEYNQESWDGKKQWFGELIAWDKLPSDKKEAATKLGFTQKTWDKA